MKDFDSQLPWDFLDSASSFALRSYELSRLSHAANLRKEIATLLDQWLEENARAMLARLLLERRKRTSGALVEPSHPPKRDDSPGSSASHNSVPDSSIRVAHRGAAGRFL